MRKACNAGMLTTELLHRDPIDDLHNIDDGKFMDALHQLPQNLRQLLQEGDMHCELREVDDRYQILKIVKKREAEFLQGGEQYFVYDKEGQRIPLSEEEYDHLLGISHNPDDIYETNDIELETIGSESTCPLDRWDVTFDATEFVDEAQRFINSWNEGDTRGIKDPAAHIQCLADNLIYSADWFPYAQDKRIHSSRARMIAQKIISGELTTKQELGAALGPKIIDQRPQKVKELRRQALQMPLGKERAAILVRANKIVEKRCKDLRSLGRQPDTICDSDRSKLWALWRAQQMEDSGEVKLMHWQFEKVYGAKLRRQVSSGELTRERANELLLSRMKQHFNTGASPIQESVEPQMPQWITEAPEPVLAEEDYEFTAVGWLNNPASLTEETEEDWQDYISNLLLDGGE